MNWDAISAIGALVGAFAVAATLVYLGKQVNEARRATEAQIYQARADAASRAIISFPVVHKYFVSRMTMDCAQALSLLSDEERYQLHGYVADLMIRMDNSYFQYRRGLLDDSQLEVIKSAITARRAERVAFGIEVEKMLLSQAFKALVRELDNEATA